MKSPGEIIVRSRSPALTQESSSRGFIYNGNDLKLDENWAASSLEQIDRRIRLKKNEASLNPSFFTPVLQYFYDILVMRVALIIEISIFNLF